MAEHQVVLLPAFCCRRALAVLHGEACWVMSLPNGQKNPRLGTSFAAASMISAAVLRVSAASAGLACSVGKAGTPVRCACGAGRRTLAALGRTGPGLLPRPRRGRRRWCGAGPAAPAGRHRPAAPRHRRERRCCQAPTPSGSAPPQARGVPGRARTPRPPARVPGRIRLVRFVPARRSPGRRAPGCCGARSGAAAASRGPRRRRTSPPLSGAGRGPPRRARRATSGRPAGRGRPPTPGSARRPRRACRRPPGRAARRRSPRPVRGSRRGRGPRRHPVPAPAARRGRCSCRAAASRREAGVAATAARALAAAAITARASGSSRSPAAVSRTRRGERSSSAAPSSRSSRRIC